jgi:predicted nucleic acid-binding protein
MDIDLPAGAIVLIDSSAFVYLVEEAASSKRRTAAELFLSEAAAKGWRLMASTLAWAELLEKPIAANDAELASRYRRLLSDSSLVELRVVDVAVAERAAALSASLAATLRRRLSKADLIHIATALELGASALFGNDEAWREVPGCPPLLLLDELAFDL